MNRFDSNSQPKSGKDMLSGGMLTVIVQSGEKSGKIVLKASASGVKSGIVEINVE